MVTNEDLTLYFRAVELLLKNGADPNIGDDYTNYLRIAREKGFNALQGIFLDVFKLYCKPN